jgi:SAM-dependent methyltransferase
MGNRPVVTGELRSVLKRIRTRTKSLLRVEDVQWGRLVMNRKTRDLVNGLEPNKLKVLEVSGIYWGGLGIFREYKTVTYPEYNLCDSVLPEKFDLIIAEQVFEHLLWPYRAGQNIYRMLNQNGHFLLTTPFLIRVHEAPVDCTRWTETGIKYFLAECGFPFDTIQTGSWGNRACIKANYKRWVNYKPLIHSLRNEPEFPYVVWALARK